MAIITMSNGLFSSTAVTAAVLAISYMLALCIYRLYFHPLAKFPGPLFARLTSLYGGYHAWKGDLHTDMWRCHQKYGDFVRYSPDRLLCDTSTSLKEIYRDSKHIQKSAGYKNMIHRVPNTFTVIEKSVHEKKRRLLSHGFSEAALRSYEFKMIECIDKLSQQIDGTANASNGYVDMAKEKGSLDSEGWMSPLDARELTGRFAFDLMTEVIFGLSYGLQEKKDFRYVLPAIAGSNIRTGVLCQAPGIAWRRLDRQIFKEAIRCRNQFNKFVDRLLNDRVPSESIQGDAFSLFLSVEDPNTGKKMELTQLRAESVNLIVAGSDTTATSLAAMMYYLSHDLDCYARVTAEVRSTFSDKNSVRLGAQLNSCVYLRAVLDEALRLSPAVGSALWREVLGNGITLDGHYIPPGFDVGTGIYSIHHNEKYFEDAFAFRPERWLHGKNPTPESEEKIARAKAAFNPFSIGVRSCIGKNLAIQELMLTMARLLMEFDFRASPDLEKVMSQNTRKAGHGKTQLSEYRLKDQLIGFREGPWVQFRRRSALV